jgi:NAD(P)-dependent dehydrogenase (short-subunit alcohol dehydrogenase family)
MDLALQGKTALVTGGSKGIGLSIAATLAQEGATWSWSPAAYRARSSWLRSGNNLTRS